jgi:flagellar motor switch/type III secretory pathway protein FliN
MNVGPVQSWRAFDFGVLPSFSRQQAAGWNALRRIFSAEVRWEAWIAEGIADLFESSAGFEIRLRQRHTIDPHQPEVVFTSDRGELTLGRDEACDVRLAPRSVGNRHTRIFTRAGNCYIEDLGSALGTFLNESRLPANQPAPVATGDQFAIFPYAFTVQITERWAPGVPVEVYAGRVKPVRNFHALSATDKTSLAVQVEPIGVVLLLETGGAFLAKLSSRLLAPLCAGTADRLGLTPADTGFLELLTAAVLERVNRDLQFPLQAALAPAESLPAFRSGDGSLAFSFAIRVGDLTGTFRLFVTDDTTQLLAALPAPQAHAGMPEISWTFPLSAGYADLTGAEVALIEPADVVLLTRETAMLFPNAHDRGWRLLPSGNLAPGPIDKYFERGCLSESDSEVKAAKSGATPDLAGLPIRMHAIIGEKEMTLAEVNRLAPGAIVEMDGTKSDPVRIALNGKIAGAGELVEVDGRLGVRILAWRAP